jgi:hypothetical protein
MVKIMKKIFLIAVLLLSGCQTSFVSDNISESSSVNSSSILCTASQREESTSVVSSLSDSSSESISDSTSDSSESSNYTSSESSDSSPIDTKIPFSDGDFYTDDLLNIVYDMRVLFNEEAETLSASMDVSFLSTITTTNLFFHLFTNSYLETANQTGIGYVTKHGGLEIDAILFESNPLTYSYTPSKQGLFINLPLTSGSNYKVTLDFTVTIPYSDSRLGFKDNIYSLTMWHPLLSKYNNGWNNVNYSINGESDWINDSEFNLQVIYPKGYKIASGGVDVITAYDDLNNVLTSYLAHGRICAFFLSKEFLVKLYTSNSIRLRIFYSNRVVSSNFDFATLKEKIYSAIEFYQEKIGEFVYANEFDVVATGVNGFAMEYSGIIQEGEDFDTTWYPGQVNYNTIAHETGHQYFYSILGSNSYLDPFIDEGFTNFITAYWEGSLDDEIDYYEYYLQYYPNSKYIGQTMAYFDSRSATYLSLAVYSGTTAVLGHFLFEYGEEVFDTFLQEIYLNYKFLTITRQGIIKCMARTLGIEASEKFNDILTNGYNYNF